ncbi:MAG: IclR family transcriptional regulator C-terminal domain-containing protein [Microbacteriaceae bacterium]
MVSASIAETARRRYGVDDEESTRGVRCFAVPLGHSRPRHYAISCSVPVSRLDADFEQQVISTLRSTAAGFSEPKGIDLIVR